MQLYKSVNDGYFEARQLDFLTDKTTSMIEWLRLPGDLVFIIFGAIPVLWMTFLGVKYTLARRNEGDGGEGEADAELFTVISGVSLEDEPPEVHPRPDPTPGT